MVVSIGRLDLNKEKTGSFKMVGTPYVIIVISLTTLFRSDYDLYAVILRIELLYASYVILTFTE